MNATKTYPTLEIDIHKIETGRGWLIMKEGEPGESPEEAELEFIDDLRARKRDAARKRDNSLCAPGNGVLSTTAGFNPHGCSMAQDNQPDLQVEGWLKTLGIESLCHWDVLVFLYRHQSTLVGAEHIARLLGDATAEVVAALDSLESSGLVQPSRVSQGVRLYQLTAPRDPTRRDALGRLMTLADSHTVRLLLGWRLRGSDRPDQNKKAVRLRGVESSES